MCRTGVGAIFASLFEGAVLSIDAEGKALVERAPMRGGLQLLRRRRWRWQLGALDDPCVEGRMS